MKLPEVCTLRSQVTFFFLSDLHIQPLILFYGNMMQASDLAILFLLTTFSSVLHELLQNPHGVICIMLQF